MDSYTIPLTKVINKPKRGRAKKAVREIKEFIKKHKRLSEKEIFISREVNEEIWKRGMFGVPRKIEVVLEEIQGKKFVFLKEGKELKERKKEIKEKKKKEEEKKEKEEETEKEKEKEKKLE
jgi:large subunit ribosomal protein L31e